MSDELDKDSVPLFNHKLGEQPVTRSDVVIILGKIVKAFQRTQNVDLHEFGSPQHREARLEAHNAVKEIANWAIDFVEGKPKNRNAE
jgi:hypothetical protein